MAVIYSKLGGCLGVTAKLGPLARTDLWAGVKGLLERLMTHLGLGSSLEDPWGSLLGVVVVRLSSWEIALFSWEALHLVDCLKPCLTDLAWLLDWPAWGELLPSLWEVSSGLGRAASFTQGKVSNCWGRIASFAGGKVSNCLERTASFPRGKESTCLTACWGWIASFPRRKVSNCLGRTASFPRGIVC